MRRSSAAVSTSLVLAVQLSTYERDDPIIDRSADVATRCVVALVEPRPRTRLSISKKSTKYDISTRSFDVSDLYSCRNILELEGICSSLQTCKSAPSLSMS